MQLNGFINITLIFSTDSKMQFNCHKCAKLISRKGKRETYENINNNNVIRYLNKNKYRYLGNNHQLVIDQRTTTNQVQEKLKE